jgi:hypothetical protein
MAFSPLLLLGATAAGVLAWSISSRKKPEEGGGSPDGGTTPPDSDYDCAAARPAIEKMASDIALAEAGCKANPNDSRCAAIPAWKESFNAIQTEFFLRNCAKGAEPLNYIPGGPTPLVDCKVPLLDATSKIAAYQAAANDLKGSPSDPARIEKAKRYYQAALAAVAAYRATKCPPANFSGF